MVCGQFPMGPDFHRSQRFEDRREAGQKLAAALFDLRDVNPLVIAIPRGGVPVGAEIARRLRSPLDVIVVRKIGHPSQPEYGIGATVEGGGVFFDPELRSQSGVEAVDCLRVVNEEKYEVIRRVECYRNGRAMISVRNRVVILVDDGLATGVTVRAALAELKKQRAQRIILAVPVASPDTVAQIKSEGVEVLCLLVPYFFASVGAFYRDFSQVSDDEVIAQLERAPRDQLTSPQ